jgi:hypothetical protein
VNHRKRTVQTILLVIAAMPVLEQHQGAGTFCLPLSMTVGTTIALNRNKGTIFLFLFRDREIRPVDISMEMK